MIQDAAPRHWPTNLSRSDIEEMYAGIGPFLLASATPERSDRLFPGDPFLYLTNGVSLGFGASGVLYALHRSGFEPPKEAMRWLLRRLDTLDPLADLAPGLLTGSAGIAWCLWTLGVVDRALDLIEAAYDHRLCRQHHSLFYGMAGVGLALLFFYRATSATRYLERAASLGDQLLTDATTDGNGDIYWQDRGRTYIGYAYGQAGVSYFLWALSIITDDDRYFAGARRALRFDLRRARRLEPRTITFPGELGNPTLEPYLEVGTAGIIKVLSRTNTACSPRPLGLPAPPLGHMLRDLSRRYAIFGGLLFGLAGMADTLIDLAWLSANSRYLDLARAPLAGIRLLHTVSDGFQGIGVLGWGNTRLSCDFATGAAGVLRTLYRWLQPGPADFTLDDSLCPASIRPVPSANLRLC